MNETTTPESSIIPHRLRPVVCFSEGECARCAKTKEYSDLWIFFTTFFIPVKWAGKAVLQAENETGEFSFAGLHGGMEWPPACALVRFCGSGFATLLVGGTQCFSEQHAIDVAETVERAVHSASEFLVRDGLIVDLGRKSTFA